MEVVVTCGKETLSSGEPSNKYIDDDDVVVGFEKDAENIMKRLTRGTKGRDVISIYGMAGLGKTTLARKVYNNPSIVNCFNVKAWYSVSQAYSRRTLLVEIFKQATNDDIDIKEDDDVAVMLRRVLIGKRYLIVLDDIWDVEAWEDLGICFPEGDDRSRVMITTRIEEVANHLKNHSDPYPLRFLTQAESLELLQKKVFRGQSCPPSLLPAALQVAKHCKGLPLVVVLVAGQIIGEKEWQSSSLWLEVASNLSSYVLGEQSSKVIQSSYDHLEDHLKTCLLYMGLFPEDHEILMSDLLKLWMAEEFILNVDTENMEEVARICLNDLLNRSLVMVSKRRANGYTKLCILHDVVREFCLVKLKEKNYLSLTVPYNPYQHLCSTESRSCIYIHDDLVKQLDHSEYQLDKIPMLESYETKCFGGCPLSSLEFIAHPKFNKWNISNPLPLLVKLRLVRVLHFPHAKLPSSWPSAVQSLTHLRYLEIYVKEFNFKWISHLLDLQTLVVHSSNSLRISLAAIWKMTKLRHVNMKKVFLEWDDNDEAIFEESSTTMLENLKTFCAHVIHVDDRTPRFWWRFPNIEELSRLYVEALPSCPLFHSKEVHTRLQSLDLVISYKGFWDSVGWESYFVFPSNLRCLCISGCFLTEQMVLNIARLKKLESLTLKGGFPVTQIEYHCWDVTNVEFPALKYLELHGVRMDEWKASEESFPALEELFIRGGYWYKEIPRSFADIPTLRLIKLYDSTDSLRVSAMKIKKIIIKNTARDSLQVLLLS